MGGRSSCACHPASPQSRTSTSRAPSPTVGQAMTTPPYAAEHHGGTQPGMSTGKDQGDCMTQCDGGRRSCWGRGTPCRGVTQPPGSAQQLLAATSHRRLRSDPGGSQLLHHSIRMWVDLSHVRTLLTPLLPREPEAECTKLGKGEGYQHLVSLGNGPRAEEAEAEPAAPSAGKSSQAQLCWVNINPNTALLRSDRTLLFPRTGRERRWYRWGEDWGPTAPQRWDTQPARNTHSNIRATIKEVTACKKA